MALEDLIKKLQAIQSDHPHTELYVQVSDSTSIVVESESGNIEVVVDIDD
jgi:hypothetical protein